MNSLKKYVCSMCGRTFKNSSSLSSHRYRYHPYSQHKTGIENSGVSQDVDEKSSVISDFSTISSPSDASLDFHKCIENTRQLTALDKVFGHVVKRVEDLESKILNKSYGTEDFNESKLNIMSHEIETIKVLCNINKDLIFSFRDKLNECIENLESEKTELAEEDLKDKLVNVKNWFLNRNSTAIQNNIGNLKETFTILEKAYVGKDILPPEYEMLIKDISQSPENETKHIVSENFVTLIDMFNSLKEDFDQLYENDDIESADEEYENNKENSYIDEKEHYSTDEIESNVGSTDSEGSDSISEDTESDLI